VADLLSYRVQTLLAADNREVIRLVAECVTAIATLSAVIVALYLSHADERRHLRQRKRALKAFAMEWKAAFSFTGRFAIASRLHNGKLRRLLRLNIG
jgi:hypothetical protein